MKKLVFTMSSIILMQLLHAQSVRWGVTAGATMAQVYTITDQEKDHSSYKPGFSAGFMADLPVGKSFSFQPGFQFLQKGGQEKMGDAGTSIKTSVHLDYLELPLNFIYHGKSTTGHFFVGLGPTVAYALGGHAKIDYNGQVDDEKIEFGSDADKLKHLEFGANALAGYESKNGWLISANYNLGISNLFNDGGTWKNNYFGLKLGFLFGQ